VSGSPVGGGSGYLDAIDPNQANYVVSTAAALKSALASASSGQIVYLADGATITLNSDSQIYGVPSWLGDSVGFNVNPGVTLAGGRSGKIVLSSSYRPTAYWYAVALGAGARMSGVIIQGGESNSSNTYHWSGVACAKNAQVDNCEIYGMSGGQAVSIYGSGVWVHHNYLHHCQCTSQSGYGVCVVSSPTASTIEANKFDYCKHAIASAAGLNSWVFRYNQLGAHFVYGQIDSHGQNDGQSYAGNKIEIYNNTSTCTDRWFVQILGIPNTLVSVYNNWTYLPASFVDYGGSGWGYAAAIGQIMTSVSGYGYNAPNQGKFVKMESYNNWYGTTAFKPSVDTTAPGQPSLITPANGQTINGPCTLDWTDVSDTSGVTYNLQLLNDDLTSVALWKSGLTTSAYNLGLQTLDYGTYYWSVMTVDGAGNAGQWSSTGAFILSSLSSDTTPPGQPALKAPANGQSISHSYTLDWTDVSDASGVTYRLQVFNSDWTSMVVWKSGFTTSEYNLNSEILDDGKYYWSVMTVDGAGNIGQWSSIGVFTADNTP